MSTAADLPPHLRRYAAEQHYDRYTPVDHAVWRFALRQLRSYLAKHAHEAYLPGLEKTGIEIERIPRIEDISRKIEKFGWRALPVSGFIPPAAFMELQALGVLPIASDVRSIDHLLYTPAPDIVHEAAGHAPMLAHPEFAQYLRNYAQVARKAIISREDMDVYEAIRELSDVKESPHSTPALIAAAEERLTRVTAGLSHVSEATWLSRMNWWTAEYGLFGTPESPRIFGAGLLSSVGESRWCLSPKVKKVPLTVECIDVTYDITEPQPLLFVTPDFETLNRVLDELAGRMAFRRGGLAGVNRAIEAATVNTVELETGVQISGRCVEALTAGGDVAYLRFDGPSQLSVGGRQLPGHGKDHHAHGFGTPVGTPKVFPPPGTAPGAKVVLEYPSGVRVEGEFVSTLERGGETVVLTLKNARASLKDRVLFDPSWGVFDIAVGASIPSVFGGPADREAYGDTDDFVAAKVPAPKWSDDDRRRFEIYRQTRELREKQVSGPALDTALAPLLAAADAGDWLIQLELYELALNRGRDTALSTLLRDRLDRHAKTRPEQADVIRDGLALAIQI